MYARLFRTELFSRSPNAGVRTRPSACTNFASWGLLSSLTTHALQSALFSDSWSHKGFRGLAGKRNAWHGALGGSGLRDNLYA